MRPTTLAAALLACALPGCASRVWVKEACEGQALEGVPFYLNKPYRLRVTYWGHKSSPLLDADTKQPVRDQDGRVVMAPEAELVVLKVAEDVVYLPDTTRLYQTNATTPPFATSDFTVEYDSLGRSSLSKVSSASEPASASSLGEAAAKARTVFPLVGSDPGPPGTTEVRVEVLPLPIPR